MERAQRKKKKKKNYVGGEAPPTSIKETHWLPRAMSLLHHDERRKKRLMGVRGVARGTRPWNLAVGSNIVFNSTSAFNLTVRK